ncbi:MAG: RnfABCDGE type electron transport complex subunit D [Candidatus Cloacimonetes bacterium]|nr:RnfABCDGE type electron transport complex subunit D [Candidatus Cloacimonadota bacterium]MCF7813018.1 RnfABCDGE type electron transport complex subunit D [Candidatus Cloacimonadota bacterium]MCF7867250.1 RnfABCDGE type electron transport complex subunit D [Candidatus Cloacimonadota bacterium]MCF7882694.1 RnfABCDGE type electron transport complex subunit D [Candidatus Cloacimonadota bacterium]
MKNLIMPQKMMNKVLYALIPILLFSIFLFGWRVLILVLISNIFAFLTEYLFVRKKKSGKVSSAAFVTASLLALSCPPTLPFWMIAVGSIVAICFGKMVYGGFGMNMFNPAIVGRTFIYISFPNAMTMNWLHPFEKFPGGFLSWMNVDAVTSATPIANFNAAGVIEPFSKLFLGVIPGSAGETSALLILLAGIYLIITKTAKWQAILSLLFSFTIFTTIFYGMNPLPFIISGGFMFGAIFMITDPVSMPKNKKAIWIYGILVGFLTVFIRKYSLFTEGFMFALLLGNTFMPIIEFGLNKAKVK